MRISSAPRRVSWNWILKYLPSSVSENMRAVRALEDEDLHWHRRRRWKVRRSISRKQSRSSSRISQKQIGSESIFWRRQQAKCDAALLGAQAKALSSLCSARALHRDRTGLQPSSRRQETCAIRLSSDLASSSRCCRSVLLAGKRSCRRPLKPPQRHARR